MYNNRSTNKWLLVSIGSLSFAILLLTIGLIFNSELYGTPSNESDTEALKPELQILQTLNNAYVELAKMAIPSVVRITSETLPKRPSIEPRQRRSPFQDPFDFFGDDFFWFFGEPQRQTPRRGVGSGFIVDKEGYILTNNHVVQGADKIKVTLDDKREFEAKLIGTDPDTDVALIKINKDNLPVAKLGDSDKVRVGEIVIAIGSPFELNRTVTNGIISATGRSDVISSITYQDFIQTNAAINPGNSGGPLVNIRGEVIGINTAIATTGVAGNVGVGFAIPINMARNIMDQLISGKKIVRGWLGVSLQEVTEDIANKYGLKEPKGALVAEVSGPAEEAGLKPGDLIIEFNGKDVKDGDSLKKMVAAQKPGEKIKVKAIRDGNEKTFTVTLGERTEEAIAKLTGRDTYGGEDTDQWLGLSVQELTPEIAQRFGYKDTRGVIITDVDPYGPAARVDNAPQRGDLILEIEGKSIKNMSDYRKAVEQFKNEKSVMIRLRRASTGATWYVVIKKE